MHYVVVATDPGRIPSETQTVSDIHSKNKTPVLRNAKPCFWCETKTGVLRILVIFQDRRMFSHINGKLSLRPFK